MVADANGADPILSGIQQSLAEAGHPVAVVQHYVVVATWIDQDGDTLTFCDSMEDQRCAISLGLLEFARAIEHHRAVRAWEES